MRLKTLLIVMCFSISLIPIVVIYSNQGFESESLLVIGLIALITFCFSIIMSYWISRSIENLTKNIDNISKGKLDVELEKSEIYEVNELTESLNRVMASLKLAINKVGVKKGEIFEDTIKAKEVVEEKYGDLLDSIAGWAWEIDDKSVCIFCSKNVMHSLGYKPGNLVGKSIFKFMASGKAKKTKQEFDEAIENNQPLRNIESWYVNKSGKKVCMLTNGVPFFDKDGVLLGYRGVDVDITKTKNAEAKINELNLELQELKDRVAQLLNERKKITSKKPIEIKTKLEETWSEHQFDSVFLFDENANLLDCNENMYKNLGYSKSEILSLNITDFDALESKGDILNKIQEAKKKGSINFKTIHKRKDGSAILVHENLQYLKDRNMFKCIVREDK